MAGTRRLWHWPSPSQCEFARFRGNLLASLGVDKVTVVAHSMGGIIGTRCTLMYPQGVEKPVPVDPLGLEDWQAKAAPERFYQALDHVWNPAVCGSRFSGERHRR